MRAMTAPGVSVVVPVFNSAASLCELHTRLATTLSAVAAAHEIILVNDGSSDQSWDVICDLTRRFGDVRGIDLMRNYGQQNALLVGIREASHEVVVTMDDDLQHPPEEIPKLLTQLSKGFDLVYGVPARVESSLWRIAAGGLIRRVLATVTGLDSARRVTSLRAFATGLREAFAANAGPFVSIDAMLSWATTRVATVDVDHAARRQGRSSYTLRSLLALTLDLLTGYSTVPLRLASVAGFTIALFGGVVLVYVVARYVLDGARVPGFPFLASAMAIFSGVQLFALGVIGEYVARVHERSMGRPYATIRERAGAGSTRRDGADLDEPSVGG